MTPTFTMNKKKINDIICTLAPLQLFEMSGVGPIISDMVRERHEINKVKITSLIIELIRLI